MKSNPNRILWKCRRGMLELDFIFMKFFQEKYPHLSLAEQKNFEKLLDEQDPILAAWIFGAESPTDADMIKLVAQLKKF